MRPPLLRLSLSFNPLPHDGLDSLNDDTHAGSTQKQALIGSSKFHHPDLASSASHVDDAPKSLRALRESADALSNPDLKSVVGGVSALRQTAKRMEQSNLKEEAQTLSWRSHKVLETLAEAVGRDPSKIPHLLKDIRKFEKLVIKIRGAMEPPIEQVRKLRLSRLIRRRNGFNDFDKRLSDLQQKFEKACSRRSGVDTPCLSPEASRVPPDPYSNTPKLKPLRRRSHFPGLKSRLDYVSSTCADVASTTLKVLEKLGSSVPIVNGVVSGVSAVLDTTKRVGQLREGARALLQHSAILAEGVDHDQSNMPPLMLERVQRYQDELSEIRTAMVLIMQQGWISRLFRLNRHEDILDTFNRRLDKARQCFTVDNVTQTRVEVSHIADSLNTLNHRLSLSIVLF